MVNTRRMESVGSSREMVTQHRTRRVEEDPGGESSSDVESEGYQRDITFSLRNRPQRKKQPVRSTRLHSKYVFDKLNYSSHVHNKELRSSRKSISLNNRSSLAVYSHNNMDMFNGNDSDEAVYRQRHLHAQRTYMTRIQRRTALSLRPISQKSYADPRSPSHFNSDSEDRGVRRSKRKRKVKFEDISWLVDNQMHKIGYPNLDTNGYSEEDSRDAPDMPNGNEIESSKRVTRQRNRVKPHCSFNLRTNGRLRSFKGEDSKKESIDENSNDSIKSEEVAKEIVETKTTEGKDNVDEIEKPDSSESDTPARPRTRTRSNFATRDEKVSGSSSSESELPELPKRKGYSLRNRPAKPQPIIKRESLRVRDQFREVSRRRFTRRRRKSSSSLSSSSSDDDVRRTKTPKSPHSKLDQKMKSGAGGSKIIPIGPETLDTKVRFSSIGGLDSHIQCLKEMILLPMMYPEVFRQFQIQPPRGVLFHGPPGTGKTLLARALANECGFGSKKVSFFMRKGADLLSKWIGESEKQLRLLFTQAAEMKPSIIFFDELDGLAPVRSSRQDQVHASIVSTLLALMDGLDNRGEVIVIGATNRVDAIDPALRRPGRFDRELYFPLPARKEREEILKVHVSQWTQQPDAQLLSYLAETTIGYCGSDLRALCTEAVIQSFRRTYPQVYDSDHRLLLKPENVKVEKVDFLRAKSLLIPASHRITNSVSKKLLPMLDSVFKKELQNIFSILEGSFPHGLNPALSKVKLSANMKPAHLMITADGPEHGHSSHLVPAMLHRMEHINAYILDLTTLYKESGRSPEEACVQVFCEAKRNIPSIIYIPSFDKWWSLVNDTVRAILLSQLESLDSHIPLLLLATSDTPHSDLPEEIQNIFSGYRKEVYHVFPPNEECRKAFFKPILINASLKSPRPVRQRIKTPPPLPKAPTPPPAPLTTEQQEKLFQQEEHTLRELRIFLRDMCKKLASNRLFYLFTKPVDTEEVPDYTDIIKQPMDLETMMMKVDLHQYQSAKDFLSDIELIVHNALEYNPAKTSVDKQIRHRACSLRDYAYTLIKSEMDSDFEVKCQEISKHRKSRNVSASQYLPHYIKTPETLNLDTVNNLQPSSENVNPEENAEKIDKADKSVADSNSNNKTSVKRRRVPGWQRGHLKKRRKLSKSVTETTPEVEENHKNSSDDLKENSAAHSNDRSPSVNDVSVNDSLNGEVLLPIAKSDSSSSAIAICDTPIIKVEKNTSEIQSPKRRLSDLASPSELLDDPLDFDDIDQALNETVNEHSVCNVPVECSVNELENILEETVKLTNGFPLQSLIDLYNQFGRILKNYSRTNIRLKLPKEFHQELCRFKNEDSIKAHQ